MTEYPVPPTGWHIRLDPGGLDWSPRVTEATWEPAVLAKPTVTVRVPYSEDGEERADQLVDRSGGTTTALAWYDAAQLPIDTFESAEVQRERGQIRITLSGGRQLDRHVTTQIDEDDTTDVISDLLSANTDYALDIDAVDAVVETETFADLLGADIEEATGPIDATTPARITQTSGLEGLQVGWLQTQNFEVSGTVTVDDPLEVVDSSADWSDDRAVRLDKTGHSVFNDWQPQYTIPQDSAGYAFRYVFVGDGQSPGIDIRIDGNVVDSFPQGALTSGIDRSDMSWEIANNASVTGDIDSELSVEIHATTGAESGDEGIYVDAIHCFDSRYNYDYPSSASTTQPQSYPDGLEIDLQPYFSINQIVSGTLDVSSPVTELALSADGGSTYPITASDTSQVSGEISDGSASLTGRVTLGRANAPERFDQLLLEADVARIPMVIDRLVDGDLASEITDMAERGDLVWELQRATAADQTNPDGLEFALTKAGQREADHDVQARVNVEARKTIEEQYDAVIVEGSSQTRQETVTLTGTNQLVGIADGYIVVASETVTLADATDPQPLERGIDYRIDWREAAIEALDGGAIDDALQGTTDVDVEVEYRLKSRVQHPADSELPANPRIRTVTIPTASSDREAAQAAQQLYDELSDPLIEMTVTVSDIPPGLSLIEALPADVIPFGQDAVIYDSRQGGGTVALDVGSRQTVTQTIDRIQRQLEDVAEQV